MTKIYQKNTKINDLRGKLRSTRSRHRLMIDEVLCEPRRLRSAHAGPSPPYVNPPGGEAVATRGLSQIKFPRTPLTPLWDIEPLNQMKCSIDQKNRTLMAHTGAGHSFAVRGVLEPARVTFRTGFFLLCWTQFHQNDLHHL